MQRWMLALLLLSSSARAVQLKHAKNEGVTPVQKVLELLVKLRDQIEEQGRQEVADYDLFVRFCKDSADQKVYDIGRSTVKIDANQAIVDDLDPTINQLNEDVVAANGRISTELEASALATQTRTNESSAFAAKRKELADGISSIAGAIAALESSKGKFLSASLLSSTRKTLETLGATSSELAKQKLDAANGAPGDSPKMEFKSNEILQILQDLLRTFKSELKKCDEDESTLLQTFEMVEGARANRITFTRQEIAEKNELVGKKVAERGELAKFISEETAARSADQSFLDDLTAKCEAKATAWDVRSQARSDEVATLNRALQSLSGTGSLYGANKKLVGLLETRQDATVAMTRPLSSGMRPSPIHKVGEIVQSHEAIVASPVIRLHSSQPIETIRVKAKHAVTEHPAVAKLLAQARAMVASGQDPTNTDQFVEVRGLIKDLISRLQQEATDEATAKSFCDTQMTAAISQRDANKMAAESLTTSIGQANASINSLTTEINDLNVEIAGLHTSLAQAAEIRTAEQNENKNITEQAKLGAQEVRDAITILKSFYGESGNVLFLQNNTSLDREGKAVEDVAPKVFEGEYRGGREESTGILGLLEIIASDFDRTVSVTEGTEAKAALDFKQLQSDMNTLITTKSETRTSRESAKIGKEADRVTLQDNLRDAVGLLAQAEALLTALKTSCVDGVETWEERKAKREQEIQALKQALDILENWKAQA